MHRRDQLLVAGSGSLGMAAVLESPHDWLIRSVLQDTITGIWCPALWAATVDTSSLSRPPSGGIASCHALARYAPGLKQAHEVSRVYPSMPSHSIGVRGVSVGRKEANV